jgi:asparagine synthase (glutamine-hydrolysing)
LGTFLSGGIDSPLVAAKMRAESSSPVQAFTIGIEGERSDEAPDASAYAQEIGVAHTIEYVTPAKALTMLDDVVTSCGEPFADYSIFPTMLIARLARRHVKVMLSGDGGDELFWGYATRFASVIERSSTFRPQPCWSRPFRRGLARLLHTNQSHANTCHQSIGNWYQTIHSRIPEKYLASIFPEISTWSPDSRLFTYGDWEPSQTAHWLRWNEFVGHLTMVLLKVDRASMHHSLEVRVPLLDREVIEVALRVDWSSCLDLKSRIGKKPLRAALARHVQYQTATKRGFEVPMDNWLRGDLREVIVETVMGRKEILGVPINQRPLQHMIQQHISGQRNHARGLWTLLSLVLWENRYFHPLCQTTVA